VDVGVDTGGTFTDVVTAEGTVSKVLSDRSDPSRAVARGLGAVLPPSGPPPELLAHGTTVATNALLEGRGARVTLVTTKGFADVIEIARQDRPALYDDARDRPAPLVPRARRVEVPGRLDADGVEIEPLGLSAVSGVPALPSLPADTEAVAVCLLHADLDDVHERALVAYLEAAGHDVSHSAEVSPEFREYERTVTTVANAALRPLCRAYLERLAVLADTVLVMTSAGTLVPAHEAAELPVALLLSGPAAGVGAAAGAARAAGFPDAVTFDMGGTSTDVCLVRGGRPEPAASLAVGGYPIRMPALDIHTIGAGGGSIAWLDPGGALRVGPHSAGADPGPAAYGRGGVDPTVTDADLALGRIPAEAAFADLGRLDDRAARRAFEERGLDPVGVVAVVDANMVEAVRAVTVQRGVDPRALALVAFGGAGPLHACAVAEALGMPAVVVPPRAGALSAIGLLTSPQGRERVRSRGGALDDHAGLEADAADLADTTRRSVGDDAVVEMRFDCRYPGQSHELTVASPDAFHAEHERRNGYARPEAPVEVVAIRARAHRPAVMEAGALPPPQRVASALGPCVLTEPDCTVWVGDGWRAELHPSGSWILRRAGA